MKRGLVTMFDLFMVLLVTFILLSSRPEAAAKPSQIITIEFLSQDSRCQVTKESLPVVILQDENAIHYNSNFGNNEHGYSNGNRHFLIANTGLEGASSSFFLPKQDPNCPDRTWSVRISNPNSGTTNLILNKGNRYFGNIQI